MTARGRLAASLALALAWFSALAIAVFLSPVLSIAANRLVEGVPLSGQDGLGPWLGAILCAGALGAGLLAANRGRLAAVLALILLGAAALGLALGLGAGAARALAGQPPAARAGLGAGAWTTVALLAAAMGLAVRRARVPGLAILVPLAGLGGLGWAGRHGAFDALSLAVEYAARRDQVNAALLEHLALSGGAILLAGLVTPLLSLWRRQGLVEAIVGGIQVVPAVALLGALVALVSGLLRAVPTLRDLGLSALGAGPALIGIAAYLLLPLWRGLATALQAPDPATIDAATGLGLTPGQILLRLRLPLGAPILIGALRVAAVQSLGLATLGALIGAGGLGRIVFDGMAQFAPDLILLGALPIIAFSLGAERVLGLAEDAARRRWRP